MPAISATKLITGLKIYDRQMLPHVQCNTKPSDTGQPKELSFLNSIGLALNIGRLVRYGQLTRLGYITWQLLNGAKMQEKINKLDKSQLREKATGCHSVSL